MNNIGSKQMERNKRKLAFERAVKKEIEKWVLQRNDKICQMCGWAAGDVDPFNGSRTVRLTIGHILSKSTGGDNSPSNLRALCTNCSEGLRKAKLLPKPDRIFLLTQIRRATADDQKAVLEWLLKKFLAYV